MKIQPTNFCQSQPEKLPLWFCAIAFGVVVAMGVAFCESVFPRILAERRQYETEGPLQHSIESTVASDSPIVNRQSNHSKIGWKRVTLTWYGSKYHGRKTASGSRYDRNGLTIAVPLKKNRRTPVVPYGTMVEVRYKNRTVTLKATDCCPAGTWDLSDAGMRALGFRNPHQKLRGEVRWR